MPPPEPAAEQRAMQDDTPTAAASLGMIRLAHVMYGLHLFSALSGLMSAAFIVTAFLTGWPSIIAVVLNYMYLRQVRGTWLEPHFRWQTRTFWFVLLWVVIALLLAITLIGIPIALGLMLVVGLWVLYRLARGWIALGSERAP